MRRLIIFMCVLPIACERSNPPARVEVVPTTESIAKAAPIAVDADPSDEPAASEKFAFADDSMGRILARILPPSQPPNMPAGATARPLPRSGQDWLERPQSPMTVAITDLPKLPPSKRIPLRPHPASDSTPLADLREDIVAARRPELPEAAPIRTPSRDVNLPIDLPPQSRYVSDRAPLDDPTAEMSLEIAVSRPQPVRERPAPFVRIDLPEPFPNRVSLTTPAAEPGPVSPTPLPPK